MNNKIIGYILLVIGICIFILTLILVFSFITNNNRKEKFIDPEINNLSHNLNMQTSYIDLTKNLTPIQTDMPQQKTQTISEPEFEQVPIGINQTPLEYNGAIDYTVKRQNYMPLVPGEYDAYPKKFIVPYDTISGFVDDKMNQYEKQRQEIVKDAYATSYQNKNTIMKEITREIVNVNEDLNGPIAMTDYE